MSELEIISFEKDTKRINDDIKQKIASHLWMFCGYNDSIYPALSIDAKYIKAICDLYNAIIDSSLVTRLYGQKGIAPKKWKYLEKIKCIRETINMLRTIGVHTVSEENVRKEIILQFRKWQLEKCGNDNPTEDEEFEKLIKELLALGKKCFNLLDTFVKDASSLDDISKNKMIEKWEDAIVEHYFKTANKNMFENKLIEWYKMKQPNGSYVINKIGTYNAINKWIMDKIYFKEQKDIDQWMLAKNTLKLTADDTNTLEENIKHAQLSIDKRRKEVVKFIRKTKNSE